MFHYTFHKLNQYRVVNGLWAWSSLAGVFKTPFELKFNDISVLDEPL